MTSTNIMEKKFLCFVVVLFKMKPNNTFRLIFQPKKTRRKLFVGCAFSIRLFMRCTWFLHMMCVKCKHKNTFLFSSFKNSFSMLCSFRYCVNFRWFIFFFIITYYCVTIVVAQCYMKTIDYKIFMKFNLFLRCMHRNIPVVLMHWINVYVRAGSDSKFTSYMFCNHSIDIFGRKKTMWNNNNSINIWQ